MVVRRGYVRPERMSQMFLYVVSHAADPVESEGPDLHLDEHVHASNKRWRPHSKKEVFLKQHNNFDFKPVRS